MAMETEQMPSDKTRSSEGTAPQRPLPAPSGSRRRSPGRDGDDPVSLGLRKLWEDVEKEPVPPEFLALLDAIDNARESARDSERTSRAEDPAAEVQPSERPDSEDGA